MDTITKPRISPIGNKARGVSESPPSLERNNQTAAWIVSGMERVLVDLRLSISFLRIAIKSYKSFFKVREALRGLHSFKSRVYGSAAKWRYLKVDGKYRFSIYIPGFPSPFFNRFVEAQMNWAKPHAMSVNRFQSVHLAITNTCPLHCEHCYEWKNLNHEETFTTDELKTIIDALQQEGCTQLHLTGGEPLVKMQRLEELIRHASKLSECWINTSGINLTPANAIRLKNAGLTGVVVSLDDYRADIHNAFRGSDHAFDWAMKAVRNANDAKLVTAFSICMTRSFVSEENLMRFAETAATSGVAFVQLLEPKAVGQYEGRDVKLPANLIDIAGKFYLKINFSPEFRHFPVFIYHGYYQRKIGCMAESNLSLYIDSAGFINACPFCHTRNFDAHDILSGKLKGSQIRISGCPVYTAYE